MPHQDLLFDPPEPAVRPARPDPDQLALAAQLPASLRLGTSSWSFPGWAGQVWADRHDEATLAREGLAAYARHPLLRTVSLDRSYYRPMSAAQFAALAAQVPEDFRFVVKAPALISDGAQRDAGGRPVGLNPGFLDPALTAEHFVQPALDGLGAKTGALVIEIGPLPGSLKADLPALLQRLARLLDALPPLAPRAPDAVIAVEVRDPEWLVPAFRDVLKAAGARYCLGLHPRLPPIEAQLPLLRAMWPGAFVCRWNLHRRHGAHGYEAAKAGYAPFDRLVDPDPATREALARIMRGTAAAGHPVLVTVNNKAEGSAPCSVAELARAVAPASAAPDR